MACSPFGSIALVSYVPAPLGIFLDELRRSFGGQAPVPAHITILPPRPLSVSMGVASEVIAQALHDFTGFWVELEAVRRFEQTKVLYLSLGEGNDAVRRLHDTLNAGPLGGDEEFEFQPHLTLGGPFSAAEFGRAEATISHLWHSGPFPRRRFEVRELVALWSPPGKEAALEWTRIWTYDLPAGCVRIEAAAIGQIF